MQLYQHDKLLGESCPPSPEMHCISEGGRKRKSSFGHHGGNSFMQNHSLLLKFKEGKKKKQTQGHTAERTLLILPASLRSIHVPLWPLRSTLHIWCGVNINSEGPDLITNNSSSIYFEWSDGQPCLLVKKEKREIWVIVKSHSDIVKYWHFGLATIQVIQSKY